MGDSEDGHPRPRQSLSGDSSSSEEKKEHEEPETPPPEAVKAKKTKATSLLSFFQRQPTVD